MIRAIRPNAAAQDDATMVVGWNIAPNVAYTLVVLPGAASCGVLLYDEAGAVLIASGAALAGTDQPCILSPQSGQSISMVDADLGWHLLLTTAGTESQRTIRIGPMVDLPDEIHPVYGDDDIAAARATEAINAGAHYIDDITVSCPLGLGASLGDVVSVPVDGETITGQVESISWVGTPDGGAETAVIRRHVAIAPEAFVEPTPPTVADDTGTATHLVGTSGNVLTNDDTGLTVVAVNGLSANVGVAVDGDNGGAFTVGADGSWTFDPDGDFALLEGSETAETSITYHASDGSLEAMATLTVTVSHANTAPVAVDDSGETDAATTTSGNVLTNDTDSDGDTLAVSQVAGSATNVGVAVAGSTGGLFTIGADGTWVFDPDGDFASLTGEQTATTSVSYHVSDGTAEDDGTLVVTVSAATVADWGFGDITTALWVDPDDDANRNIVSGGIYELYDKSGNDLTIGQATASYQPALSEAAINDIDIADYAGGDWLRNSSLALSQPITYVLPVRVDSFANGPAIIDGVTSARNLIGLNTSGQFVVHAGATLTSTATLTAGAWAILAVHFEGATSWARLNGTQIVSGSAGTSGITGLIIGDDYSGGNTLDGAHGVVVAIPGSDILATVQKAEGRIAHDYGLTGLLPADHPYKLAAPTA